MRSLLKRNVGAAQSMASDLSERPRLGNGHAPRSKGFKGNWIVFLVCLLLDVEAELFYAHATGAQAPEVHGQLPGHSHNGFLTCRSGGLCSFTKHDLPLLH